MILIKRNTAITSDLLPIENMVYYSRWSAREINTQTKTGEVVCWRQWEKEGSDVSEVIAIYYGPEVTRDHRGLRLVHAFAAIKPER